jgi:hypothetical protein
MFSRCLLILVIASAFISCVAGVPTNQRPAATLNDPAIIGRSELLSFPELHAMLSVARQRLASLDPWSPIYEVKVIDQNQVEVSYGDPYVNEPNHMVGYLTLERRDGHWRITGGGRRQESREPFPVFISESHGNSLPPGLTKPWSEPLTARKFTFDDFNTENRSTARFRQRSLSSFALDPCALTSLQVSRSSSRPARFALRTSTRS